MQSGINIEAKPVQPSNAETPMVSFCIVTVVNPVQFLKAFSSIVVTVAGIVIEVNAVQPSNWDAAILLFWMSTWVRLVQFMKAPVCMDVTVLGMVIPVMPEALKELTPT